MAGHMFADGSDSTDRTHRDGYDEFGQLVGEGTRYSHALLRYDADDYHHERRQRDLAVADDSKE